MKVNTGNDDFQCTLTVYATLATMPRGNCTFVQLVASRSRLSIGRYGLCEDARCAKGILSWDARCPYFVQSNVKEKEE